MKGQLTPTLEDVQLECVLMQAWKKTSSYLRYHSWYADTLGIDYQTLRIPHFIAEIQEKLNLPEQWQSQPIEMVPAPKSQRWGFNEGRWGPEEKIKGKMRPLAHVALEDQVVATTLMMCLADRVETALKDPRLSIDDSGNRRKVLSYGHRLFCGPRNSGEERLRHRWGSTKLYRQYFQDYQTFLRRPGIVADSLSDSSDSSEIAIVHSDLSKFYDRVRPSALHEKLRKLRLLASEEPFFVLAERVLNWHWSDSNSARKYAKEHCIDGFESIALPQGLVVSGFFANVFLSDFDSALRRSIGTFLDQNEKLYLEDACYYVDDLRLVVRVYEKGLDEEEIKRCLIKWLQSTLDLEAPGLLIGPEKTKVTVRGRESRFLVPQSKTALRIQSKISGPFDMLHGAELIGEIEGFFHTQKRYSASSEPEQTGRSGIFVGMSDMGDQTAARFAAARFRRTFRSLRPLLETSEDTIDLTSDVIEDEDSPPIVLPDQLVLSKQQLDERAKLFAALLIEEWMRNPGNIRLLRIAFDMYPDAGFLGEVLDLLRHGLKSNGFRGPKREVCIYCLAELFRVGATETAIVEDDECLPEDILVEKYHEKLVSEATSILRNYLKTSGSAKRQPWYLMQQVMLYLLARNKLPEEIRKIGRKGGEYLLRYRRFAAFLGGQIPTSLEERAIFLIIARTGFGINDSGCLLSDRALSGAFLTKVNDISPAVASHLWRDKKENAGDRLTQAAQKLGLEPRDKSETQGVTIADLASSEKNPFCFELNFLALADWLLNLSASAFENVILPWQIYCHSECVEGEYFDTVNSKTFQLKSTYKTAPHLFIPPDWCQTDEERRKFQIGLLLRFAVRGTTAFDSNYLAEPKFSNLTYSRPISHWEQQRYSGYQGRSAFGAQWLPLSSFSENILFELLRWPGAGISSEPKPLDSIREEVKHYLNLLYHDQIASSSQLFLEQKASFPYYLPTQNWERPLRVGIVQSIIPSFRDYKDHKNDPELRDRSLRTRRRAHLATLIQSVSQMIRVRESHRKQNRPDDMSLDLLVFPELAIHPDDLAQLILPFVRKHKCIVLCGMVYHKKDRSDPGSPLLNSCLWVIPEWTSAFGFQIHQVEQGKKYLSRTEKSKVKELIGFRPVQWLIEYEWTKKSTGETRPLVLSASVCFDATDLTLAAELRSRSDLYIVCAMNKDIKTFDRMSQSLSYHMFQGVIVVNNGQFGGSSFFMPFKDWFHRQIFHLHGQPQASISFAEIHPEKLLRRPENTEGLPKGEWKMPPANTSFNNSV